MFDIFASSDASNKASKWQRELIALMAKIGVNYNSFYSQIYEFTDFLSARPRKLNVITQFFPPRVRFKNIYTPVHVWQVKIELLRELPFVACNVLRSESSEDSSWVNIYIPQQLESIFIQLQAKLKEASLRFGPEKIRSLVVEGILTSSGRSFWIPNMENEPTCIKVDTIDIKTLTQFLNSRRLDPGDANLAVLITEHLSRTEFRNYFEEDRALHIKTNDEEYRYVALERRLNFGKCEIHKGDFLIPMQAMLSEEFWNNEKSRKVLGLQNTTLGEFFTSHLAREFARLIKNSVEHSFVHFEIHQQNLTCHLRDGNLQKIIVHDLQDIIFDPICFLFSSLPTAWDQKLKFISSLYRKRFFNLYGEPRLKIEKHRHYFTPSTFYRRYFRNFGNYTRIFNKFCGEDYLFSRKLEQLLVTELAYTEAELGLSDAAKNHPNYSFLSKNPFWVIDQRIKAKQTFFLYNVISNADKRRLDATEMQKLIQRLSTQVSIFSDNFLALGDSEIGKEIASAHEVYKEQVYILELFDGTLVGCLFLQTIN